MKITIILFLCMMMIFTVSCKKNDVNQIESDDNKPQIDIADSAVNDNDLLIIKFKNNAMDMYGLQLKAWEDYIYDKYDLNIDIININNEVGKVNIEALKEKAISNGLVYIRNRSELSALVDSNLIVPINEYIDDIPIYATANNLVFSSATDWMDRTWMFPVEFARYSASARYYNYDWLVEANMTTPKTIDEFYEYAKFLEGYTDPEHEDKEIYIAEFYIGDILDDFHDIFKAFGCYPGGEYGHDLIGYNPNKREFEVSVLNEGFIEAMTFIKNLYDEGLIIEEKQIISGLQKDRDYLVGSSGDLIEEFDDYYNGWDIGLYLTGTNEANLIDMRSADGGLAVLNGTTDVTNKLNSLFNVANRDYEATTDFFYGMKGIHYEIVDGKYNFIGDSWIGMLFVLDELDKNLIMTSEDIIKQSESLNKQDITFNNIADLRHHEEAAYIDSPLSFSMPFEPEFALIHEMNLTVIGDVKELMKRILYYNVPIEDAIEAFEQQLQAKNILKKIDEMNSIR